MKPVLCDEKLTNFSQSKALATERTFDGLEAQAIDRLIIHAHQTCLTQDVSTARGLLKRDSCVGAQETLAQLNDLSFFNGFLEELYLWIDIRLHRGIQDIVAQIDRHLHRELMFFEIHLFSQRGLQFLVYLQILEEGGSRHLDEAQRPFDIAFIQEVFHIYVFQLFGERHKFDSSKV